MDYYIIAWFLVMLAAFACIAAFDGNAGRLWWPILALGAWRSSDILQANVNMQLFDAVRIERDHRLTSPLRSTLIAVWNYLELIGWFSLFYLHSGGLKSDSGDRVTWFDSLYFSTITQLTIGFGDLKPVQSSARFLAMMQGLLGTLFLIFAIGRFANLLPQVAPSPDAEE